MYIIVKKYQHHNRSLPNWDSPKGKYISSKAQYEKEMAKGGFVAYDPNLPAKPRKPYKLSEEKMRFLHQVKDMADKKGNIKVTDRFVKGLQEHNVIPKDLNVYKNLPKDLPGTGGFNNAP